MKELLFKTQNDWAGLVARIAIGGILLPHGAQKMLGWFGGYGFSNTMSFFTEKMHLPWLVAFLVIMIEFVGALSLLAGFASRIWASLTIVLMLGIIFTSHIQHGFFMNWFGSQKGEGYEFHLLFICVSVVTVLLGSGKYAVDALIVKPKD